MNWRVTCDIPSGDTGHLEMVKFLLDAGADQEHKTDEMHTALMEASMVYNNICHYVCTYVLCVCMHVRACACMRGCVCAFS